jgi:uncharacterized repeat protein (TIGR01451 family)
MGATRQVVRMLLALAALAPIGCFGVSQNPSYFPYYLPTGDIIRTHAKPPGCGYFANFDPHAVRLEVTPLESSGPTKTQFLIVAAVTDENGQPRRSRRVEWLVEGAGDIVEVDESGYFAGRGYKVDNHYAVSYTDYKEHTLKTADGREVCIGPGQSWCVLTSAVEGDTHVIVYAPEIATWERHKVFVTRHWCDAQWRFPPATTACPAGAQPVLSTQVLRASDSAPLPNYKVRYRVFDGAPANLLPAQGPEAEVVSDSAGHANVTLAETAARAGTTRVAIEIVRPEPGGPGVVVGRGETMLEWQTPQLSLAVAGPAAGVVGGDLPITVTVSNPGQQPTQPVVVRMPVPQGLAYLAGDPPAQPNGGQLVWQIPSIPGGGNQPLRATFRGPSAGVITATATAQSGDGLHAESQATVRLSSPQLLVGIDGGRPVSPGDAISLEVSVANTGNGPATNVRLRAEFDTGLSHETNVRSLEVAVGTLEAGRSQTVPLTLTATQAGKPGVRVFATADGGLKGETSKAMTVAQRALQFSVTGTPTRYVNRPGPWDVRVANTGDAVLTNVTARVRLPKELRFQSATANGQLVGGDVMWGIGEMRPGERRDLQLIAMPVAAAAQATLSGAAAADKVAAVPAEAAFEVMGMPVLHAEIAAPPQGVPANGKAIVILRVTNQGTLVARNVNVAAVTPTTNLTPRFASGPTVGRVNGDRVDFAPIDRIEPGQSLTFQVEVGGNQTGDGRVRVEVRSDMNSTALTVEEAVRVVTPPPAGRLPPSGM